MKKNIKKELQEHYDQHYYSYQIAGVGSAEVILTLLYEYYRPLSVIDVGCGVGAWLAVAEALGSKKLIGLDGRWVNKENLLSKNIDFTIVDFEEEIEIVEKYDLCISLEVAEHISEIKARNFIDTLCKASDVVLFSAAIKDQGGTNHINEQWQSYWVNLFESNDYECLDIFREAFWQNEAVNACYRQNIFLFVNRTSESVSQDIRKIKVKPIINIVHPKQFEKKVKYYKNMLEYPTLIFCLVCIKRYIFKTLINCCAKSNSLHYLHRTV